MTAYANPRHSEELHAACEAHVIKLIEELKRQGHLRSDAQWLVGARIADRADGDLVGLDDPHQRYFGTRDGDGDFTCADQSMFNAVVDEIEAWEVHTNRTETLSEPHLAMVVAVICPDLQVHHRVGLSMAVLAFYAEYLGVALEKRTPSDPGGTTWGDIGFVGDPNAD